ncbi:MAG TPA: hypothetical protein DEP72_09365 [Clostridiales bacterium]|nr:MAG: hypothetical protein A2Y18_03975 [Clostridiales bacterium GWD2_32_19]HCC08349.1 hypothetical protein [Clostridiales bacterium]
MNKGYIMIKPDGHPYLKEFEKIILNQGLEIEEMYYIDDWKTVCTEVNRHDLIKRDKKSYNEFFGHVWLNNYMFGNSAVVLIISKKDCNYKELLDLILYTKKQIRNSLNATKDGTFMIALDMKKVGLDSDYFEGYLKLVDDNNQQLFSEYLSRKAKWIAFYLPYVHCPDPNIIDNEIELNVLKKMDILSNENRISKSEWDLMKKFKSCEKININ